MRQELLDESGRLGNEHPKPPQPGEGRQESPRVFINSREGRCLCLAGEDMFPQLIVVYFVGDVHLTVEPDDRFSPCFLLDLVGVSAFESWMLKFALRQSLLHHSRIQAHKMRSSSGVGDIA